MVKKRGTGFRPDLGASSCYQDSGSRTNRDCSPINLGALPFGVDGLRAVGDNAAYNRLLGDRYKGGKHGDPRVPQGEYGEDRWIPSAVLSELFRKWKAGENVNRAGVFHFEGRPEDWDGVPTLQEETDFAYLISDQDGLNILPDSGRGGPKNPTPVKMKGAVNKYVFVLTPGGTKTYWLNTLWTPGMGPMYGEGYPVEQGPEVPPSEPTKPPIDPPVKPVEPQEPPPTANLAAKVEALLVRLQVLEKDYGDLAAKVTRGFRAIRKGGKP